MSEKLIAATSRRILFICGSFENGRDGVGDYTRRLCEELTLQGNTVAVAAINDSYVNAIENHNLSVEEKIIEILRLPQNSGDTGFKYLAEWIDAFNPDWLSLQYVPFSFHPKGLSFGLAKKLKKAGGGRKWEVMFHELWVGMSAEASKKEKLWGRVQLLMIRLLIRKIKPLVLHTHSDLYKKQLQRIGSKAILLPLFSNIPVSNPEQIQLKMSRGIQIDGKISIVIFGGIHVGGPIRELAKEARTYCDSHGIEIELVIVGRSGKEQERWAEEWQAAGLSIIQMGEQNASRVSEILTDYNFGVFTTPLALVEKSGSVAAMREHGIHLLCVSRDWNPSGIKTAENPYGIVAYKKGGLAAFFEQRPDFTYIPTTSVVAKQFVSNLSISS